MRPEAKALAIRTRERGTIALSLPDGSIQILRRQLAELETALKSKSQY